MSMIEGLKKGARLTDKEILATKEYAGSDEGYLMRSRPAVSAQQDKDFKAFAEWLDKPRCKEEGMMGKCTNCGKLTELDSSLCGDCEDALIVEEGI